MFEARSSNTMVQNIYSVCLERGGSIGRQFGGDRDQAPTGPKVTNGSL